MTSATERRKFRIKLSYCVSIAPRLPPRCRLGMIFIEIGGNGMLSGRTNEPAPIFAQGLSTGIPKFNRPGSAFS